MPSLEKYVLKKLDKDESELTRIAADWAAVCEKNKLSYEIEWFGVPVIQTAEDLILLQELIFKVQPDVIVELGVAHGGGAVFEASMLELLGHGKVVGVEVDFREHNKKVVEAHPLAKRIKIIEGSSIDPSVISEVGRQIPWGSKVIVCLDSNHTKEHVLKELELYEQFVGYGGYIVVFDMIASDLAKRGAAKDIYIDNGPAEAVKEFLESNRTFKIDTSFNKLYSSHNQNGYLKRV